MDPITIGLLATAGYFGYRWYRQHKFHWLYVDPESATAAPYYKGVVAQTGARGLARVGDYITTVVRYTAESADETNAVGGPTDFGFYQTDNGKTAQVLWQVVERGPVFYKVKFAKILSFNYQADSNPAPINALDETTQVPMMYVGTILAKSTVEGVK